MREIISLVVLGNEFQGIASQIRVVLQGTDLRYKKLFQSDPIGGALIIDPLYSPNRGTEKNKLGYSSLTKVWQELMYSTATKTTQFLV